MTAHDERDTPGPSLRQEQRLEVRELMEKIDRQLEYMEYDLDLMSRALGLLMKEHNLERQWNELKQYFSERRRSIV